jgi:hypothetical protein
MAANSRVGGIHAGPVGVLQRLLTAVACRAKCRRWPGSALCIEAGESIMTALAIRPELKSHAVGSSPGNGLAEEVDESLDVVLGPETTTYRLHGRYFAMLLDTEVDPLHFLRRVIRECVTQAAPTNWVKRAQEFHKAMPRTADCHDGLGMREMFAAVRVAGRHRSCAYSTPSCSPRVTSRRCTTARSTSS